MEDFTIELAIEAEAQAAETPVLERVFAEYGLHAEAKAAVIRASLDDLPWVIYMTAPLQAFLFRLAQNAADPAWHRLAELMRRLIQERNAARKRRGSIVMRDQGASIVIGEDLPDEAYRDLAEKVVPGGERGYFVWDPKLRAWRNRLPGESRRRS